MRPPAVRREPPEIAVVARDTCDACGLCMPLCPPGAITMLRTGLVVDALVCTGCRKCIDPCPVGALSMSAPPTTPATARIFAP